MVQLNEAPRSANAWRRPFLADRFQYEIALEGR